MNKFFNCILDLKKQTMKNLFLILLTFLLITSTYSQEHIIGLGVNNFSNASINYERIIHSELNLKLSYSRNFIDGNSSNKKITYNYTSLSAKFFNGEIFNLDFYHGPGILVGYYYEYTNFNNNTIYYPYTNIIQFDAVGNDDNYLPYYQNSAMISPEYHIGLAREIGSDFYVSGDLTIGTHFLFNDYMSILDRYNIGNFVPYIWLNLYFSYNYNL
ncbi:MAG: hypothetical protein CMP49_01520 [Flavobacteriales bacterium]|nr:hypothetical protein [Flavobacteriales bacterium]